MTGTGPAPGAEEFSEMFRRNDRRLRGLAFTMLNDHAAMEDVLQDAYLNAWRSRHEFRHDAQLDTWLYRIATNACIDHQRSERRRRRWTFHRMEDAVAVGVVPDSSERMTLNAALMQLRPQVRAVVVLVDHMGFTYEEVAGMLDIAVGTVGSQLNRAHKLLRTILEDEGAQ